MRTAEGARTVLTVATTIGGYVLAFVLIPRILLIALAGLALAERKYGSGHFTLADFERHPAQRLAITK